MRPTAMVRLLAAALLVIGSGCRKVTDPDPIIGTFLATTFTAAPTGQPPVNMLARGATVGINIANNLVTAGSLVLPPSATGGAAFTANLAGVADTTGGRVRFLQPADSFVRDLVFTLVQNRLEAVNQTVADTVYTLVLTRQ